MEEAVVQPSVFVVDGQTTVPFRRLGPSKKKPPCGAGQLSLGLLLLLLLAVVAAQGWFLLQLHGRVGQMARPPPNEDSAPMKSLAHNKNYLQNKPAAHLIGTNFSTVDPLQWETERGQAFLKDFGYSNSSLVVQHTGYYYVYSKLLVATQNCPREGLFIKHTLYLRTPRYPVELELLVNQQSRCGKAESPQIWWDSSSLGGVLHLEAGDKLLVRLKAKQVMPLRDGTQSYFGAFML